ncbi:10525_t:CDS:2 [Diversispora eburnea]|uniref:10525_t:CDS:1 n=1 Tax=Diversispora eburnea TaxID=1213867 RepID=A0A9N9B834_9GLOM|nr:10525_t:CDS:2 [Diversispora eburnea]
MSSKYSALPDIDTQQDVYETPDSPEDVEVEDDEYLNIEEPNEDIISEKIIVGDTIGKFKETPGEANETEAEKANRHKKILYKQYIKRTALDTNEYEIIPKDPELKETPLQKLHRLMFEVQDLGEEIEKNKDKETPKKPPHSALLSQISSLQNDLTRIGQTLGETDISVEQDGTIIKQTELGKKLIHQLRTFKNIGLPKENGKSDKAGDHVNGHSEPAENGKNMVTYELFYSPETARVHTLAKTTELDERISTLEKLLGTAHGQNFEDLSTSITNTNLLAEVDKLDQHMQILAQPRHLESVSRKAKTLVNELEKVNELRNKELANGGFITYETEEKINYLFALLDKVDPLMTIAPSLVNRLKSLQQLHQEAAVFSETIKMLSSEQNKISEEVKNLDEVTGNVNDDAIQRNIEAMDSRISDLTQRLDKLLVKK